ncbi:GntR family transcriptional regulator [Streptomyces showdoensis]|uniref:GntR family transcriptional regulator n=1 Tax=Streptomyces showdoensis TaxID=68268 RepID=UPI000F4F0D89|nr:GntR family transcriptional regulator [Streptomyces showdoensis]
MGTDAGAGAGAPAGARAPADTGPGATAPEGGWLRDQVCEGLRDRIITGRLKPGDRLVERDVAEDFGVSRVPVREAIRILIGEGFLQTVSQRRIVVRELTRQDVENLFDMREALEVLAVRRASERRTLAELDVLARLLARARAATDSGGPEELSRANAAFHGQIVRMSRNELLVTALESLEGRLRWLFQQVDDPGPLWEEHRLLYEAVAAADADAAAEHALHHVRHYRAVAMRLLFSA